MTFTEIMKAVGGLLFIVFIVYGLWMFCGSIVDFLAEKFGNGEK